MMWELIGFVRFIGFIFDEPPALNTINFNENPISIARIISRLTCYPNVIVE